MTLAWADLDLDARLWTIRAAISKNKRTHTVPLSPLALDILEKAARLSAAPSPWVFRARGDQHLSTSAIDFAMRREAAEIGLTLVPHDLRRSAATHIGALGIPRIVISELLNHAEPGVTAIYDRHDYLKEKRVALDSWSARLAAIVSAASTALAGPGKVVATIVATILDHPGPRPAVVTETPSDSGDLDSACERRLQAQTTSPPLVGIVEPVVGLGQALVASDHERGAERIVGLAGGFEGGIGFPAPKAIKGRSGA